MRAKGPIRTPSLAASPADLVPPAVAARVVNPCAFPDFIRYLVKRLKALCSTLGKKRIAQTLAKAGLALGVSTVARMLKERDGDQPDPDESAASEPQPEIKAGSKPVQTKSSGATTLTHGRLARSLAAGRIRILHPLMSGGRQSFVPLRLT